MGVVWKNGVRPYGAGCAVQAGKSGGRQRTLYTVAVELSAIVKRCPNCSGTNSPNTPLRAGLPSTETKVPMGEVTCTAVGVFGSQRIT